LVFTDSLKLRSIVKGTLLPLYHQHYSMQYYEMVINKITRILVMTSRLDKKRQSLMISKICWSTHRL